MAIKRRRGTPWDSALAQSFVSPALPRMTGGPFGTETTTKRPFTWDPWTAALEIVHSPVYLWTGDKKSGKSTGIKVMILRYGGRKGRNLEDGIIRPIRILINDRKLEGRDGEFTKVVNYLHGTVVPLNNFASINIFDPKMNMDEKDHVETAINIVEMASGLSPLPRFQNQVIAAGVWKMLRNRPQETGPELLEAILYGLTKRDLIEHLCAGNPYLKEDLVNADPRNAQTNIPQALVQEDAAIAGSHIGEVLRGSYGGMFGSKNSLRKFLTDEVVLLDWTDVSEKARTLLSAMLWKWRDIAQRRGDQDMIPDLFISDEESEALRNRMYARFMSSNLKKVRMQPTAYALSTQHETTDLAMAGEVGSELRTLSESIGNSIGARFIGKQPDKKPILDFYREIGLSELNVQTLPHLKTGQFFFFAPGYAPVPFQLDLTDIERSLTDTTSAIRSMTRGLTRREAMARPLEVQAAGKE